MNLNKFFNRVQKDQEAADASLAEARATLSRDAATGAASWRLLGSVEHIAVCEGAQGAYINILSLQDDDRSPGKVLEQIKKLAESCAAMQARSGDAVGVGKYKRAKLVYKHFAKVLEREMADYAGANSDTQERDTANQVTRWAVPV